MWVSELMKLLLNLIMYACEFTFQLWAMSKTNWNIDIITLYIDVKVIIAVGHLRSIISINQSNRRKKDGNSSFFL